MYTIPTFFNLQCSAFHGETITCLIAFYTQIRFGSNFRSHSDKTTKASDIKDQHLSFDHWWAARQFSQPASYGYWYTAGQQNYSNHLHLSKYRFSHYTMPTPSDENEAAIATARFLLSLRRSGNALNGADGQWAAVYSNLVTLKTVLFAAKCQINFRGWQRDQWLTRELSFEPEMTSFNAVSDDLLFQTTIYRATTGDLVYFAPNDLRPFWRR